jgi:GntR family transcriptional regulator
MSLSADYFRIDPNSSQPLYHQIEENLIRLIDNELLRQGEALPAERQLSEYYGVNRMTVRRAIEQLVQKGFLHKKQGVGTFVSEAKPVQQFTPNVTGFSERMRKAGFTPSSKLLQRSLITPEPLILHKLGLTPNSEVIMLMRLRLVNDEPLMLETSYLPHSQFPALLDEDLENQSLYRVLDDRYGVAVMEAEHTLEPTLTSKQEAAHLKVSPNKPAMLVRVLARATSGMPVEFSKSIVRGDRCRYYFRVNTHKPIIT